MRRDPTRTDTARNPVTEQPPDPATNKRPPSRHSDFHTSRETDPEHTRRIEETIGISSERAGQADDLVDDVAQLVESLSTELARRRKSLDRVQGATS